MPHLGELSHGFFRLVSEGLSSPAGLGILFVLIAVGEIGVPTPVVIESAFLAAGVALFHRPMHVVALLSVTALASVVGASAVYWVGVKGTGLFNLRKRVTGRLPEERAASLLARLSRTSVLTIALLRLVPGLLLPVSLLAGASRVPYLTFAAGVVAADLLWNGSFLAIGAILKHLLPNEKPHTVFWLSAAMAVSLAAVALLARVLLLRWKARRAQ